MFRIGMGTNVMHLARHGIVMATLSIAVFTSTGLGQKTPTETEGTWWAYLPLQRPAVPKLTGSWASWIRNPIDAFVVQKLVGHGMTPSAEADRRTLLRRLTFNLHGLPPTLAEVNDFLNDPRPDAYERVVDRLLASPRYGERWARHWMDVAHFAETHGHDQDVPRENAWPYRDYLIEAFNAEVPYARFIQEQIAADVLFPENGRAIRGLGFLAAGPWDESSLKDIREDSIDRKAGQYLDRDDMLTTVTLAFLSTTAQCARCHDHPFDPISQKDYYGLQAIFAGVDRANRAYDTDPTTSKRRTELLGRKAQLATGESAARSLLQEPGAAKRIEAWESARRAATTPWTTLEVQLTRSDSNTPAKSLADGSLLLGGTPADKDVYYLEAPLDRACTAIRLEVLSDPSLPQKGPGRQDNGNLHLSEFVLETVTTEGRRAPVPIARAFADFNQAGWEIDKAIDGKRETAWGIHPAVGQSHEAIFVLHQRLEPKAGVRLAIALEQRHGGRHLIGRLRLSRTEASAPSQSLPLPTALQRIFAKPTSQRTEAERLTLAHHVFQEEVREALAKLPPPAMVYAATSDFLPDGSFRPAKGVRDVHLLKRGNIFHPRALAQPAVPSFGVDAHQAFAPIKSNQEGERRAALANWIVAQPLAWRSIANRVWHYHMGRGLAASPSDLGNMGGTASHPELLDWLAQELHDNGGSLKKLHRLIVTSATYRQASSHRPEYAKIDADNILLWRAHRTRVDAESLRDAVLAVSGKLDLTMGGPSVKHFVQKPGIHRTPEVNYQAHDPDAPGSHRRSVYRFVFRTLPDPFMDSLDCPDASQFTPSRSNSVTVQQALTLLNDPFMVRMSEHFAARLKSAGSLENQVRSAWRETFVRDPTDRERASITTYAQKHGLANACRMLWNTNEFMFVD